MNIPVRQVTNILITIRLVYVIIFMYITISICNAWFMECYELTDFQLILSILQKKMWIWCIVFNISRCFVYVTFVWWWKTLSNEINTFYFKIMPINQNMATNMTNICNLRKKKKQNKFGLLLIMIKIMIIAIITKNRIYYSNHLFFYEICNESMLTNLMWKNLLNK